MTYLRILVVVVPQHRAALYTETSFRSPHLGGLVIFIEAERGNVHPAQVRVHEAEDRFNMHA